MMTVWWANNLKSKDDLHVGQVLRIPPVTGLVVTVKADRHPRRASPPSYKVDATDIVATNGLDDPNLVVGQVLVAPRRQGRRRSPTPTPKPATSRPGDVERRERRRRSPRRPPATYTGGKFLWPVVGGGNYISQYFHYGHSAIDIAADYGTHGRAPRPPAR